MKALLKKYKSVVKFILTFLLVYISFSLLYKVYLGVSDGSQFYPDYITHLVSKQTESLLNTFGYRAQIFPHPDEPSTKVMVNGVFLVRITEGCNAISVIILFASFIIAFSRKLKVTFLYIFSGSVLIYVVNIIRIALIIIGIYHYPEAQYVMHTVIFPAIIYGMMFLLWIFWVNRFSKTENKDG